MALCVWSGALSWSSAVQRCKYGRRHYRCGHVYHQPVGINKLLKLPKQRNLQCVELQREVKRIYVSISYQRLLKPKRAIKLYNFVLKWSFWFRYRFTFIFVFGLVFVNENEIFSLTKTFFFVFVNRKTLLYWLQFRSSDKSPQSLSPSQVQRAGIQRPVLRHWNWFSRQPIQSQRKQLGCRDISKLH